MMDSARNVKTPLDRWNRGLGGLHSRSVQFWRREDALPLPGLEPGTVQPVAVAYSEYSVLLLTGWRLDFIWPSVPLMWP
jgi:hypothetical protein